MSSISRRALLTGLVAAFAVAGRTSAMADTPDLADLLLSVVGDRKQAAALGETWINQDHGSLKASDLANHLADMLHAQGWSGSADPAELRQSYNAAVRADYRNGETVTVAGWQLAKTQAELCALAYYATAGML